MNIIKCNRGHFYDAEKYFDCPHCKGERGNYPSMPQTVSYANPNMNMYPQHSSVPVFPETKKEPTILLSHMEVLESAGDQKADYIEPQNRGIVVGWLVGVAGPGYGRSYSLYTSDTTVDNVVISFDMNYKSFVLNKNMTKVNVWVNNRQITRNEFLKYMDKILVNGTEYMLVTLCKDGFSWWQSQPQYEEKPQTSEVSYVSSANEYVNSSNKLKFTYVDQNYNASLNNNQSNEVPVVNQTAEDEDYDEPATSVLVSTAWRCMSCNAPNTAMAKVCRLCDSPREW